MLSQPGGLGLEPRAQRRLRSWYPPSVLRSFARRAPRASPIFALALTLLAGCSDDAPANAACVSGLNAACSPLYTPTFDQIFARTLQPTCAVAGASCHAPEGAKGGLVFDDPASSYARLLGQDGSAARVVPGDAACSALVERLRSSVPASAMPPGAPLGDAELCDFVLWINAGAKP